MAELFIITGASRGIGLATAELALDQGARVLNLSRTPCPDSRVENLAVDFLASDWRERCAADLDRLLSRNSTIALIHNAGRLQNDSVATLSAEDLRGVMEVNVIAPLSLTQLVLPFMAAGSSVIYVGSTLSEKAVPGACSYVVSKHALTGLMRSTCQDLAGRQIHCACVCPGFTDTQMLRSHVGEDKSILESIASGVTFGRLLEPEEIARTLIFCVDNPAINGALIHANLGQIER